MSTTEKVLCKNCGFPEGRHAHDGDFCPMPVGLGGFAVVQKFEPQTTEKVGFTPGPWELCDHDEFEIRSVTHILIAHITEMEGQTYVPGNGIRKANARLIAQAPAMLEALEKADRLLTQCLSLLCDNAIQNRVPFGLTDEVKQFVVGNIGGAVIQAAKGSSK